MEREKLIRTVTAAQNGDSDALNMLFNTFYNDVYYFALKTVKDDDLACDITQETFVEIINTLGNLEEPVAFVTWMKKITYHQCTRYFKKKKDVLVEEDEDGNTIFDTLVEENSEFIPDEALDKEDFKKTIMAMIDELSEEQRAAVMMFYYDELSIKQIAEIQGTNENTVKSRLNYAKKGIKKSVEDYEKKNGVKLHCVGILPLLLWLFKDYFAQSAPASATVVAEGVATATGTAITVNATATATATVTTAAVGLGAKIASIPLVVKIVAGIVAAAIIFGGGLAIAKLALPDDTPDAEITQSPEATLSTEQTERTETTPPATEPVDTNPAETTSPATEPVETAPTHTHSYTSNVIKTATCTEKGVTTFTCSCGDSYTEEINAKGHAHTVTDSKKATCTEDGFSNYACACGDAYTTTETAKGHSMSGWTDYTNSSNLAPGEKRNSCANCDYYESEIQYDRMFVYYAEVAHQLGTFSNAQELQGDLGKVITAAVLCQAVSVENVETDGRYLRIISVSDMDAFTTKCLGTTFDYTGIDGIWVLYESQCHYDASTDSLVIIPSGMGGGDPEPTRSITLTTDDNINFTVSVEITWYYGRVSYGTMTVALEGGNYIVTSYSYIY